MTDKYTSDMLGVVVAKLVDAIGYSSTHKVPFELIQDLMQRFIQGMGSDMHKNAEHANRQEPTVKDAFLTIRNLKINVKELIEYIQNVDPILIDQKVPAYPVKKESNLNFLEPNSAEALARPSYIYKYLPPIFPPEKDNERLPMYKFNTNQSRDYDDYEFQKPCVSMSPDGVITSTVVGRLPLARVPKIVKRLQHKN